MLDKKYIASEKEQGKKAHEIGREEFTKLCYDTTTKYEEEFKKLFYKLGVSAAKAARDNNEKNLGKSIITFENNLNYKYIENKDVIENKKE